MRLRAPTVIASSAYNAFAVPLSFSPVVLHPHQLLYGVGVCADAHGRSRRPAGLWCLRVSPRADQHSRNLSWGPRSTSQTLTVLSRAVCICCGFMLLLFSLQVALYSSDLLLQRGSSLEQQIAPDQTRAEAMAQRSVV